MEKNTNKDYFKNDSVQYREALGEYAAIHGCAAAQRVFQCSKEKAKYWKKKFLNPNFKPGTHGGARNIKFKIHDQNRLLGLIWALVKKKPDIQLGDIVRICAAAGFDVNNTYLYRTFKLWGWTRKEPLIKQFNKYDGNNILHYMHHIVRCRELDPRRLKYLDESHFIAKVLQTESVLCAPNEVQIKINNTGIDTRYSMTLLTTITQTPPIIFDLREESNTQWDFLAFATYLCSDNYLADGDFLIVDNATVHGGNDTYQVLIDLLSAHGVTLIYLPTYSPELNPCELVFAQIKAWMKANRTTDPFWVEICRGAHQVSWDNMINYYRRCISIDSSFR